MNQICPKNTNFKKIVKAVYEKTEFLIFFSKNALLIFILEKNTRDKQKNTEKIIIFIFLKLYKQIFI